MCMKYVNSVATIYTSMSTQDGAILSFNMPVNGINVKNNDTPVIDRMVVLTQFNFLGTAKKENKQLSVLENNDIVDIVIRLTKCNHDPEQRFGIDLDSFSLDFSKIRAEKQLQTACFDFYDFMRITHVDDLHLPYGTGKYVIKVLIKRKSETNYTIQSMTNLSIR